MNTRNGANGGIRTPRLSPADFKSAVYAVPPHSQLYSLQSAESLESLCQRDLLNCNNEIIVTFFDIVKYYIYVFTD